MSSILDCNEKLENLLGKNLIYDEIIKLGQCLKNSDNVYHPEFCYNNYNTRISNLDKTILSTYYEKELEDYKKCVKNLYVKVPTEPVVEPIEEPPRINNLWWILLILFIFLVVVAVCIYFFHKKNVDFILLDENVADENVIIPQQQQLFTKPDTKIPVLEDVGSGSNIGHLVNLNSKSKKAVRTKTSKKTPKAGLYRSLKINFPNIFKDTSIEPKSSGLQLVEKKSTPNISLKDIATNYYKVKPKSSSLQLVEKNKVFEFLKQNYPKISSQDITNAINYYSKKYTRSNKQNVSNKQVIPYTTHSKQIVPYTTHSKQIVPYTTHDKEIVPYTHSNNQRINTRQSVPHTHSNSMNFRLKRLHSNRNFPISPENIRLASRVFRRV